MIGRVFLGRYEVVAPLGQGGMGRVYLARERQSGHQVVVKLMHDHVANQRKFRDLFKHEMELMRRFRHPYAVALFGASLEDPQGPCIVMEYIRGVDLERLRHRHRRLPPAKVGRLLGKLCEVLQAAHEHGIVHRDLKPANIMVVGMDTPLEILKVMDFGLAKLADGEHVPMQMNKIMAPVSAVGTPEYMCPEQVRGEKVDHRGDIYSVGVILFELLTGRLPFVRPTTHELLLAHANDPPPTFADVGARGVVPPAIEAVVQSCLAKFPAQRPQDAMDLARRYEAALGQRILPDVRPPMPEPGGEIAAPAPPTPSPSPSPAKKPIDTANAVVHQIEAAMLEPIANLKLLGYLEGSGAEVLEVAPGLIRVRLGGPKCNYQFPAGRSPSPASRAGHNSGNGPKPTLVEVELHLEKQDDSRQTRLQVTLLVRGPDGNKPPTNPEWQAICGKLHADLKDYLAR